MIPDSIVFTPIGTIHSPFTEPAGMPIQPAGARDVRGTVEIDKTFRAGLRDLEGFSRIILIYVFHRSNGYELEVIPFLDTVPHGVFATRAPRRPNAIGLSIVKAGLGGGRQAGHRRRRCARRDPAPGHQTLRAGIRLLPGRAVGLVRRVRGPDRGDPIGRPVLGREFMNGIPFVRFPGVPILLPAGLF